MSDINLDNLDSLTPNQLEILGFTMVLVARFKRQSPEKYLLSRAELSLQLQRELETADE